MQNYDKFPHLGTHCEKKTFLQQILVFYETTLFKYSKSQQQSFAQQLLAINLYQKHAKYLVNALPGLIYYHLVALWKKAAVRLCFYNLVFYVFVHKQHCFMVF